MVETTMMAVSTYIPRCAYSGTSDKGPSEIGTTSLQGTKLLPPKCPLFGGSTVVQNRIEIHIFPRLLVLVLL